MPVGRQIQIDLNLKKKLTVTPFMPGAPVPVNYTMYKLTNNFMYIPRYFNDDGILLLNYLNYCNKFIYPIKKRGICKPKFVKIALSEFKYPANAQPKEPEP